MFNLFKKTDHVFNFDKDVINKVHKYRTSDDWWQRPHSAIKGIVIHHPAIRIDRTAPFQTNEERMQTIMNIHLRKTYTENIGGVIVTKPWQGMVYHYFIARDYKDPANKAQIYKVNNDGDITWHTAGMYKGSSTISNNYALLSICVDGYLHQDGNNITDSPTESQLRALDDLVAYLCEKYNIPRSEIYGHNDLRPTACPGSRLIPYVQKLKQGLIFNELTPEQEQSIVDAHLHETEEVTEQDIANLNNDPEITNPPKEEEPVVEEAIYKPLEGEEREKKILELSEKVKQDPIEYAKQLLALADENTIIHLKKNYGNYKKIFINFWVALVKIFRWLKTPKNLVNAIKYSLYGIGFAIPSANIVANGLDSVDFIADSFPAIGGIIIQAFQWLQAFYKKIFKK